MARLVRCDNPACRQEVAIRFYEQMYFLFVPNEPDVSPEVATLADVEVADPEPTKLEFCSLECVAFYTAAKARGVDMKEEDSGDTTQAEA